MGKKSKATVKGTARLLTFAFVAFLMLDLFVFFEIRDLLDQDSWEQKTIVFRSCRYVDPEDVTDALPAPMAQMVNLLRWDEVEDDGYYQMTDGDAQVWVIHPGQVDSDRFRETVREGDSVTIWWEQASNRDNVVRAIEGYYGYEEAVTDREGAARRIAAILPFTAAVTVLAGYWLIRLKREGETFLEKLPKWVREGD